MKIIKNKFFHNTFILILSGMATKILGLFIKILFTRIVGTKAISLYVFVMPTYSLLLTISSFAMPTSIAKLIASKNDKKLLNSALWVIIILNFLIILFMLFFSPYLANNLLKKSECYPLLIGMSLTLPFASIACILKGYYYGIEKMHPHVISNLTEQLIRILLIITIMPKLIKISYVHAAAGLILTSFITELASIIIFLLYMNKKDIINLTKISFNKSDTKDILSLSFPTVASRIIGNIAYFFEPIILTNILLYKGFSENYILESYGAYNAYAISTLTIPSFFISAIAFALIPEISKYLKNKNYILVKKRLKQGFSFTFIIGFSFTFIIFIFRKNLLLILYNTSLGENYIKLLAPFFILFYFEAIYSAFMQSIGKTKITFLISLIGTIIKLITMIIFGLFKLGIYSLLISEIINIILVVFLNHLYVKKYLKKLP